MSVAESESTSVSAFFLMANAFFSDGRTPTTITSETVLALDVDWSAAGAGAA